MVLCYDISAIGIHDMLTQFLRIDWSVNGFLHCSGKAFRIAIFSEIASLAIDNQVGGTTLPICHRSCPDGLRLDNGSRKRLVAAAVHHAIHRSIDAQHVLLVAKVTVRQRDLLEEAFIIDAADKNNLNVLAMLQILEGGKEIVKAFYFRVYASGGEADKPLAPL